MAVRFEAKDGIAVITLDRPKARNAIDHETAVAVAAAIDRIHADPTVRVAVLTGAGGNFCAGMDLKAFLRGEVVKFPGTGFAGMMPKQLKLTDALPRNAGNKVVRRVLREPFWIGFDRQVH